MTNARSTMASQRARLMERLKAGPVSPEEARDDLGITQPSARIWELRRTMGVNIATVSSGKSSVYVLMPAATFEAA